VRFSIAVAASLAFLLPSCSGDAPSRPAREDRTPSATTAPASPTAVAWKPWSPAAFEEAKAGKKLVLLDLGTGWCHWCHVMEETTYKDAEVQGILAEHFVALRVDADGRPDLANRYEDYGWPATIVFDATGLELVKFRGYIEPVRMRSLLRGVVADPTPGPSALVSDAVAAGTSSSLSGEERAALLERWRAGYDRERAGWGTVHKYLDGEAFELAMRRGLGGDSDALAMARATATAERTALIDPVWGGAYQYSHGGVWENPHFEKIMQRQAIDMEAFALAYEQWGDAADLAAAKKIEGFLASFLTAESGAFYTSQDADLVPGEHSASYFALDDAGRRKLGVPRVDQHIYARENGWAIEALARLSAATGDPEPLQRAVRAAEAIMKTHVKNGGFKHDAADEDASYLGDSLVMARALLRLYLVTGEKRWLDRSVETARSIAARFAAPDGFVTACTSCAVGPQRPELDENVGVARFMNLLHRVTGDASFGESAELAMRYAVSPDALKRRGLYVSGVLLADEELRDEPLHVTIQGSPRDGEANALFRAALALPTTYCVVERETKDEPAAALLCGHGVCRPPVTTAEDLRAGALDLSK
jgi:uncharacterized protein YyaL (SSP411 family)